MSQHDISLDKAVEMTKRYRENKDLIVQPQYAGKNLLSICESFNADIFTELTTTPGYAGIRIYYGMDDGLGIHAILVATDAKGNDILPSPPSKANAAGGNASIGEESFRCPPVCPPPSPLNGF